jgi:hypothetical protein
MSFNQELLEFKQTKNFKKTSKLIQYFGTKYKLNQFFDFYVKERVKKGNQCDVYQKQNSLCDLIHFVYMIHVLLEFYVHEDNFVHLSHPKWINLGGEKITFKLDIMSMSYSHTYPNVITKKYIFNMLSYMFAKFSKMLYTFDARLKKNEKGDKEGNPIFPYGSIIRNFCSNIDIIFYLTFIHLFPETLQKTLSTYLHITPLEQNIINKCKKMIDQKDGVCYYTCEKNPQNNKKCITPYTFLPENNVQYYKLSSEEGLRILIKIISDLRKSIKDHPDCNIIRDIESC